MLENKSMHKNKMTAARQQDYAAPYCASPGMQDALKAHAQVSLTNVDAALSAMEMEQHLPTQPDNSSLRAQVMQRLGQAHYTPRCPPALPSCPHRLLTQLCDSQWQYLTAPLELRTFVSLHAPMGNPSPGGEQVQLRGVVGTKAATAKREPREPISGESREASGKTPRHQARMGSPERAL